MGKKDKGKKDKKAKQPEVAVEQAEVLVDQPPSEQILAAGRVQAQPEAVFAMLTNPTHLREWLCDEAVARPVRDGRIYLAWNDGYASVGQFTDLAAPERVGFTWQGSDEPASTSVEIDLTAEDGATFVTVRHTGFGDTENWQQTRTALQRAWQESIANLASVLETGEDLRFTRRPMLGVNIGEEVNPGNAARFGMPGGRFGVRLDGVVPGMGAEAAGLRANDILVSMDKSEVTDWASLAPILSGHRAGDQLEVGFFRDGKLNNAEITLSARPLPEVPADAASLAKYVEEMYADYDDRLAALLDGVDEEAAARRPGPGEWSTKDVIAHLLEGEIDNHSWIVDLVQGNERTYQASPTNSTLRTSVTADSYATVGELLADLQRHERQTVSLLAGLPDEFVRTRPTFWRLSYSYTQNPDHLEEHLDQIREALRAAVP
jgi:uncharacterized protein YndB with AHSA1/START domain